MVVDPIHVIAAVVGFASAAFLWLALLAGLALSRGWMMTRLKHSTMLTLHGCLALMGLTLGVVHGFAQLAPPATTVRLVDVIVPFTNHYDPWGIGAGVLALELMIAVALSVLIQKWMGFHRWRALHATVYATYTLMTGHILMSGTETGGWLVTTVVLVPWLIVVLLWMTGSARGARGFADRINARRRAPQTSIQVDPMHCARFGFCEQEAPEIFALRGDGQLAYHAVVSDEQLDAAVRAARACPARAIALARGGAGDQRVIPLRMVAPSEPPVSPAPRSWPPNDHSYPRNGRR
jgi:ferredoxin/DMSO/TMAO reductase YedYZ heme-binding membrane subunit